MCHPGVDRIWMNIGSSMKNKNLPTQHNHMYTNPQEYKLVIYHEFRRKLLGYSFGDDRCTIKIYIIIHIHTHIYTWVSLPATC